MAPRETENNAYAKVWSDQQRVLWHVMVFSGVVNFHKQIKKSKKYRQAISKKSDFAYHLFALWKFNRRAFPFYTPQVHGNDI